MKLTLILIFLMLIAVTAWLIYQPKAATVTSVQDGDTITLSTSQIIRLYGIDAPEHDQPYGRESRETLNSLIYRKPITFKAHDIDKYGRTVAQVFIDGIDASLYQLQQGSAWHYTAYDQTPAYIQAESNARASRLGLWANPNPVPPWEWRVR